MNTLICTQCKRLWIPETGSTCPKCSGELKELLDEHKKQEVPSEIRYLDLTKKMITLEQGK